MVYDTRESIELLGVMDQEFAEFLRHNGPPTLPDPSAAAAAAHKDPKTKSDIDLEYTLKIPMRDGHESEIRIHKPPSATSCGPLVVLLYGGGFIAGDNTQLNPHAKTVAALYGATVVNLSYRLAPVHKFPIAPNDVWDSLQWVVRNAQTLGADPSAGFILGGVSAGANLAAVAAQKALNESLSPAISGVWLSVPPLLEPEIVPEKYKDLFFSREQNADAPIVNTATVAMVNSKYQPDFYSPDYSPFNAKDPHKGFPPVYFQVCGMDPLRDDGLIYEKVLRDNGVITRMDVYAGIPHGHGIFAGLKSAQRSNIDAIKGIGWLLGQEAKEEEIKEVFPAPPKAPIPVQSS